MANAQLNCSASLSTFNNIPTGFGRHNYNHQADLANVVARQIMNKVSKRCVAEVRPLPALFSEKLNKLRDNEWDDTVDRSMKNC